MVSAEAAPFSKVGGMGDVVSELSRALRSEGVDVRSVTPLYRSNKDLELRRLGRLSPISIGSRDYAGTVYADSSRKPSANVFIENSDFFDRPGVYADPESGEGYSDSFERFLFFSLACLQFLTRSNWKPHILHCHDSHTALIPAYLRLDNSHLRPKPLPNVLTVHNLQYQGVSGGDSFSLTGLDSALFSLGGPFEYFGDLNMMKAGISFADCVTTVSPRYAREIQSEEYGCGLHGVLRERRDSLRGILNGIDVEVWDPSADPLIYAPFSSQDLSGKSLNKRRLQEDCGLPLRQDVPLLGMVSRLTEQKGFDLVLELREQLADRDLQLIVLGQGERRYREPLRELAAQLPDKFCLRYEFSEQLAHRVQAGCDMLLAPSRFEPCGLTQMHAMRYGTVPVVRHTGGLADTVEDFDPQGGEGCGFKFYEYSSRALLDCIERASSCWRDAALWRELQARAMALDFSWQTSAQRYRDLYSWVLETEPRQLQPT